MEAKISGKVIKEFVMDVLDINKEQLEDVTFLLMTFNHSKDRYEYTRIDLIDNLNIGALIESEEYLRFEYPTCILCRYTKHAKDGASLQHEIILNQKNCTYTYEEDTYYQDLHGRMYFDGIEKEQQDLSLKLQAKFINSVKGYADALKVELEEEYNYWTDVKENDMEKLKEDYDTKKKELTTKFNNKFKDIKAEGKQLEKLTGSQPDNK